MDTLSYLGQGFDVALSPNNLVTALAGTTIGTIVGLLPGLGPINGGSVYFYLSKPPHNLHIIFKTVSTPTKALNRTLPVRPNQVIV